MIATLLAGCGAATAVLGEESPAALAEIGVDAAESTLVVTGRVVGMSKGTVDARMTIERIGASGRVSTAQSGTFNLSPGDKAEVARTSLSYGLEDRIEVSLAVTRGGEVISEAIFSAGN